MDLGTGYAQGIGTVGLGAGLLGGAARLGAKALPAAAGSLTRFAGAAKNVLPKSLQGIKTQLALSVAPVFTGFLGASKMNQADTSGSGGASEMNQADASGVDGYNDNGTNLAPGGVSYPGGFSAPQPQQRWDAGLSPSERFQVLNQTQMADMNKSGNTDSAGTALAQPEYPDIRMLMKNPPPPGEYISSPIPIWQAGFKQHDFNIPKVRQQGYGPVGDFIKQLIFQVGMPMLGMRNPFQPDFSKLYGSLQNNESYKLKVPQTFNYY
jgi:hypothetical protein